MGSVRQIAGRTFVVVRSSNGNGTRTTLPFIAEWPPVTAGVNILRGITQEIKCRIPCGSPHPFLLVNIRVVCHQEQDAHPTGPDPRDRLIEMQYPMLVYRPCR